MTENAQPSVVRKCVGFQHLEPTQHLGLERVLTRPRPQPLYAITFVGLGYAARQARHIRMSAIYEQLNDPSRKGLQILIAAGTAALMFFFAWKSGQYVMDIYERGRVSASLQIPMWTVYTTLPAGFVLAGIQYLLTIVRNLTTEGVWRSFTEKDVYASVPEQGGHDKGQGDASC